jgi:hypothetical protein
MKGIKLSFKGRLSPPKAGSEMTGLPEVLGSCVDEKGKTQQLVLGPRWRESLEPGQVERVARLREVLAEAYPMTMEGWIDGLLRDIDPEREIRCLEACAAVYGRLVAGAPGLNKDERGTVYAAVCRISSGSVPHESAEATLRKTGVTDAQQLAGMYAEARRTGARP